MSYESDRRWSDRYIPAIKAIVGPYLLVESSFDVDTKQAADLVVLTAKDMKIAARVRRAGFSDRYPNQFTIRLRRDNGMDAEMTKIADGWGDWMFYGHALDADTDRIGRWMIINLHSLRAHMLRHYLRLSEGWRSTIQMGDINNGDGTHFRWFDIASFPPTPKILIARGSDELRR